MIDMREQIASAIAYGCRRQFTGVVEANMVHNTSGCPVVIVTIDGMAYNVTITKARNIRRRRRRDRVA